MIALILTLALLQDGDVEAFLAKDAAAEKRLLEMGPYAVRPLLKARDKDPGRIGALLGKIKIALLPNGSELRNKLERKWTFEGTEAAESLQQQLQSQLVLPMFSDPHVDPPKRSKLKLVDRPVIEIIEAVARETGMEYGFFHGHVVLSTPDRLWPAEGPPRIRKLDDAEAAEARKRILHLGSDALEERQKAADALLALGVPCIPLLESESGNADVEIAARCKTLVAQLRKPPRLGTFGPAFVESQKLAGDDAKLLPKLSEVSSIKVTRLSVAIFIRLLLGSKGLEEHFRTPPPGGMVTLHFDNVRLLDITALVTQSCGLDFAIFEGKIAIDRRDELEKTIGK